MSLSTPRVQIKNPRVWVLRQSRGFQTRLHGDVFSYAGSTVGRRIVTYSRKSLKSELTKCPVLKIFLPPTRKARQMLLPPPENPLERLIREIESSVRLDINVYGAVLAWTVILFFLYYCLR